MYSERLIEHFENPHNAGQLGPPAVSAEASNPACGDRMRLSVRFENGAVAEARYQVQGCTASIAAGSALTVWLAGKTRSDLAALKAAAIEEGLGGLNPESRHAAVLCVDAVRAVLGQLSSKEPCEPPS
jgi:nitrogen fixation protein NifU and related proteins